MPWATAATGPCRRNSARIGHAASASPGTNGSNTGGIVSARAISQGGLPGPTVSTPGFRRNDVLADDFLLPLQRGPAPHGTVIVTPSRASDDDHGRRVVAGVALAVALVTAVVTFAVQPSQTWYP